MELRHDGVISGNDDLWVPDRIATLAERRNSDFTLVELTCDVEELARRIDHPERAARLKMTDAEGIRRLHKQGTPLIDGDMVIDTTDRPPGETAALILDRLG